MPYEVKSSVEDADLVGRRRAQIVAAATKLFAAQGYFRTTIKDIAKQAGISQGLIYHYVSDKEDVLLLVLLDVLDSYARELPAALASAHDPLDQCFAAIRAYLRVVDKRRKATVLAYRSTQSLSENRRAIIQAREIETNALIKDVLVRSIEAGQMRAIDADIMTYQIVMMAHGWALKYWFYKGRTTLDAYLGATLDILFRGVLTESGQRHYESLRKAG